MYTEPDVRDWTMIEISAEEDLDLVVLNISIKYNQESIKDLT